jgi:hypothetical protein
MRADRCGNRLRQVFLAVLLFVSALVLAAFGQTTSASVPPSNELALIF